MKVPNPKTCGVQGRSPGGGYGGGWNPPSIFFFFCTSFESSFFSKVLKFIWKMRNFPRGEFSERWIFSGGNFLGGNFPRGEYSVVEFSDGKVFLEPIINCQSVWNQQELTSVVSTIGNNVSNQYFIHSTFSISQNTRNSINVRFHTWFKIPVIIIIGKNIEKKTTVRFKRF